MKRAFGLLTILVLLATLVPVVGAAPPAIDPNCPKMSGPGTGVTYGYMGDGTTVLYIRESQGDWTFVQFSNGPAWVPSQCITGTSHQHAGVTGTPAGGYRITKVSLVQYGGCGPDGPRPGADWALLMNNWVDGEYRWSPPHGAPCVDLCHWKYIPSQGWQGPHCGSNCTSCEWDGARGEATSFFFAAYINGRQVATLQHSPWDGVLYHLTVTYASDP